MGVLYLEKQNGGLLASGWGGQIYKWPEVSAALTEKPTQCYCCIMNLYREILHLLSPLTTSAGNLPDNTPLLLSGNANNGAESPELDSVT